MHVARRWFSVVWIVFSVGRLIADDDSLETAGVLRVPVDRLAGQQLETAAAHLERGEPARAAAILGTLWFDAGGRLAGQEGLLTSLADQVISLTGRLPETERVQFWQRIGAVSARTDDVLLLETPTAAGLASIERQAANLKDLGNFELAAAAYLRAAKHPAASKTDSLRNHMLRIDLLAELSGPQVARSWLETVPEEVRRQSLVIAGESMTVEAWLTRPRNPQALSSAAFNLDRPTLAPIWEWQAPAPGNLTKGLTRAGEELRAHGLARLPGIHPIAVGSRIVTRTLMGLACVDAASGQLLWELHHRPMADRATLAGQQNNPLFSGKLFAALHQQLQTNTLLGAMTHDDSTIFQVVEAVAAEPAKPSGGAVLEAVDIETGKRLWRTRGPTKSKDELVRELDWRQPRAGRTEEAKGLVVCGPPLVLGNRLYLLAEQSSELMFLAVNRGTLEVDWSLSIGHLLPDASRAAPRTYIAAPLIWTGERIVCATNCGAVICVDPLRPGVRWISRYPIELWSVGRLDPTSLDPSPAASLRTWREASVWSADDRLVCVSPESPRIHVLNADTGRSMAAIPRDGGVKILSADARRILVLEPLAIRAHDLHTGKLLWRTVIGEIRGAGAVTDRQIVQPLADGSAAILSKDDGRRLPGAAGGGLLTGNLVQLADGWLSADEFRLRKFGDASLSVEPRVDDPMQRAELHYALGRFDAARRELRDRREDAAQKLARSMELAELQASPGRFPQIRDELLSRSLSPEQTAEAYFALADAALVQNQFPEAVQFALDGLDLDQTSFWTMRGEPLRRVRADLAFQGVIAAAWAKGQATLVEKLQSRWQRAREQPDPFALQRLEQRWRTLEFTRDRLVDDAESVFLGTSLMTRELSLLAATRGRQDAEGLRIAWNLRGVRRTSGFVRDAEVIEQQLMGESSGQILEGKTVRRHLQEQGLDWDRLLQARPRSSDVIWPDNQARVTSTKDSSEDAYQTVIPVEAEADSIWERVDVTVDRQGQILRFIGDDQSGAWTLGVPRGSSQLQQYPLTYQGWGWGRLLLVRIGTQLAAVSPWNEQGEPQAQLLWSLDLLGAGNQLPEQLVVERLLSVSKRANESFRIVDQYGRDVCFVGPVRPGFFCYMQQGKLVAVETQTGKELWQRWDIAPGVMVWGDDESVVLLDPGAHVSERLSARDGRQLATSTCQAARHVIWHAAAGKIWTSEQQGGLKLVCHDLIGDARRWEREFPQDCIPVTLDDRTGAVLDPRGVVHLLELESGNTLEEPLTIDLPRPIERVLVSRDAAQWYLGISGPADRSFEWTTTQPLNSFRRPLLHGPLLAIDRRSRQIAWTREISGEPWLLDQNKSTPVLVQIYKTPPPMNGQAIGEGVLRLLDKKTGRELFQHRDLNLLPYYSLLPMPDYRKLEVRTNNTLFQIDYGPEED